MADIQRDPKQILRNNDFDLLYSLIFFLEDINLNSRKEVIQLLTSGLKGLIQFIEKRKLVQWA
jgi:hypothetical protein